MNSKNVDWDEQKLRVAAAFSAIEDDFIEHVPYTGPCSKPPLPSSILGHHYLKLRDDLELEVDYSTSAIVFELGRVSESRTSVAVGWDGALLGISRSTQHAWLLAEGLYCLGLLSPKVESALQIGVDDSQKGKWDTRYHGSISSPGSAQ